MTGTELGGLAWKSHVQAPLAAKREIKKKAEAVSVADLLARWRAGLPDGRKIHAWVRRAGVMIAIVDIMGGMDLAQVYGGGISSIAWRGPWIRSEPGLMR
jgi:predicted NBD/HSP70 family sugar kinase